MELEEKEQGERGRILDHMVSQTYIVNSKSERGNRSRKPWQDN